MSTSRAKSKPAREFRLVVDPDGTLRFLYHDALAPLLDEGAAISRASHVEPDPACPTRWVADMSPVLGPVLGPFALRQDALAAEVAWLEEHRL